MVKPVVSFAAVACIGVALRCMLAVHPHSGLHEAPLRGDFEAQRHWVEVTHGVPRAAWYRDGPGNSMQHWGLDYPPLSALHAWGIGAATRAAIAVLPVSNATALWEQSFGLVASHGAESDEIRFIMRAAALVTDVVMYFSSVWALSRVLRIDALALVALVLALPQSFIDHGHLQFNSVPGGLFVAGAAAAALWSCNREKRVALDMAIAVAAATAVMFKHMSLFWTPGIGAVLLSHVVDTYRTRGAVPALGHLSLTVAAGVAVFAASFAPLNAVDVLTRMFPFHRGLFEDKVANVWCSITPVWRVADYVPVHQLVRLCTACTAAAFFPSVLATILRRPPSEPTAAVFRYAAAASAASLSFFLFAFQVHEKGILLPAAGAALAAVAVPPHAAVRAACDHFVLVAVASLWPLAVKDSLTGPWFACVLLAAIHSAVSISRVCDTTFARRVWTLSVLSLVMTGLFVAVTEPGPQLPDLHALAVSIVCCVHFVGYWAFWTYQVCTA
jgi:alpha-1,3-glucosyltransferase